LFLFSTIVPVFAQNSSTIQEIPNEEAPAPQIKTDNHDYVGWNIGIAGVLIGIAGIIVSIKIYKKQSKAEKEYKKIQKSIELNSLKIINYYLEVLGKDLGKTASIVKEKMNNGAFEIKDLKQLLLDHHKDVSEMFDILNRELSFVRPNLKVSTYDKINAACYFVQDHNKYADLEERYPEPEFWLDSVENNTGRISIGISTIVEELDSQKTVVIKSDSEEKQKSLALDGIVYGGIIALGTTVFATGAALWIASATMIASASDSGGNGSLFSQSLVTAFQQLVPVYTICGMILVIAGFIIPMIKLRRHKEKF